MITVLTGRRKACMNRLFVDSDIIIDLLAKREHYLSAARLLTIIQERKVMAFTTPIVLANVDYIITKYANRTKSKKAIRVLRKNISVLSMGEKIVDKALESSFADFEDALQYYAADAHSMDFIVTRNEKDYRRGKIRTVDAQEFVDLMTAGDEMEV